jgi:hypothetical protein
VRRSASATERNACCKSLGNRFNGDIAVGRGFEGTADLGLPTRHLNSPIEKPASCRRFVISGASSDSSCAHTDEDTSTVRVLP